jgi:hypothetical protein
VSRRDCSSKATQLLTAYAVLCSKEAQGGEWTGELLTEAHNGFTESEIARVRAEHPGEDGALMGYRVLGAIMVTRGENAIFLLPSACLC